MSSGNCKKTFDLERRTVKKKKKTFYLCVWKHLQPEVFSPFLSQTLPMNIRKKFVFQQAMNIKSGAETKN